MTTREPPLKDDNEALYDALAYKLPKDTPVSERARMQVLALATASLSQGPALSQAATDLLRSKSLERQLVRQRRLVQRRSLGLSGRQRIRPGPAGRRGQRDQVALRQAAAGGGANGGMYGHRQRLRAYRDLLRMRTTEKAFGLSTSGQVQKALSFPLSGKEEAPGVITMRLGDLVVVFNATPKRQSKQVTELAGAGDRLHPVQAVGADRVVKTATYTKSTGTFEVPGRTVAVFKR